jgi:deoxyribonuclease V
MRRRVRTVAGCDCAFVGTHRTGGRVLATAVLCDAQTLEVLASAQAALPCTFPYVPGLLSFREAPAVLEALAGLPRRPDLVMIDGQGLAHPRGMGIASHVGLLAGLPTIGAAKSRLCGSGDLPRRCRGAWTPLMLDGRRVGAVVRTREGVAPMFVSVGHGLSLAQAIAWVVRCAVRWRLPEPTRRAHQAVTALKRLTGPTITS